MKDLRILLRPMMNPILFGTDLSIQLHEFSRLCALDVIDYWEPPAIVREYLTTDNWKLHAKASKKAYQTALALTRKIWAIPDKAEWTDEYLDLHAACDAAHLSCFVGMPESWIAGWVCSWQASKACSFHSKHGFQAAVEMEARHRHRLIELIKSTIGDAWVEKHLK
ncbi:hypothetical protein KAR91_15045 [Candidatus Pacearchaeota archaeon]|nr:hypothetical protein [Candidatus Pacearchaeota archaeon]